MKSVPATIFCAVVACTIISSSNAASLGRVRRQAIPREFANINIENYLKNERAVAFQLKCIVYDGPCDRIGKYLKVTIPELLTNQCTACDPAQRQRAGRLVQHIQQKFPKEWADAVQKFQGGQVKKADADRLESLLGVKLDSKLVATEAPGAATTPVAAVAPAAEVSTAAPAAPAEVSTSTTAAPASTSTSEVPAVTSSAVPVVAVADASTTTTTSAPVAVASSSVAPVVSSSEAPAVVPSSSSAPAVEAASSSVAPEVSSTPAPAAVPSSAAPEVSSTAAPATSEAPAASSSVAPESSSTAATVA